MTIEELKNRQAGIKVGSTIKTLVLVGGQFRTGKVVGESGISDWLVELNGVEGKMTIPKTKVVPNSYCNAKFKIGDKVISQSGKIGIVEEDFDNEKYAVQFDGSKYPDKVEGWKLKLANACRNAAVSNAIDEGTHLVYDSPKAGKRVSGIVIKRKDGMNYVVSSKESGQESITHTDVVKILNAKSIVANALAWCGKAVCNSAKAQISKYGNDWYYVWADGSKNGKEGPFKTAEQATIAAKTDGFSVVNAVCNGQTEFERYAEIAEKAARSAYDRGDKAKVQEILKDLKSRGGMSSDKAIKKIEAKYVNAKSVCNGYMTLRKKGGGVSKVYKGDEVEYKGHSFTVKEVGSPQLDKITLDADGDSMVVKGTDSQLFAVNAEPVAKNAGFEDVAQEISRAFSEAWDAVTRCRQIVEQKANKITTGEKNEVMKDVAELRKIADRLDFLYKEYGI